MKFELNGYEFDSIDAVQIEHTTQLFDDTPRGGVDGGESKIYHFAAGHFQVTNCRRQTVVQYIGFERITGPTAAGDNRARIVSA